jgi:IstB-like ATP binding protein
LAIHHSRRPREVEAVVPGDWREVFPNAACVVSLVDRLLHNSEIVAIDGESYRLKEARDRTEQRTRQRRGARS